MQHTHTHTCILTTNVLGWATVEGKPGKPQDEDTKGSMFDVGGIVYCVHKLQEVPVYVQRRWTTSQKRNIIKEEEHHRRVTTLLVWPKIQWVRTNKLPQLLQNFQLSKFDLSELKCSGCFWGVTKFMVFVVWKRTMTYHLLQAIISFWHEPEIFHHKWRESYTGIHTWSVWHDILSYLTVLSTRHGHLVGSYPPSFRSSSDKNGR